MKPTTDRSFADRTPYTSLPSHPQNVIVIPYYRPPRSYNYRYLRCCLLVTAAILLFSTAIFFLFPSDPTVQVVRLRLTNIQVYTNPKPTLDLAFSTTVRVLNRDFFSLDYESLVVSVGYRGKELGVVRSKGGKVKARGSSYVEARVDLNGLEVVKDVFYLIEDLARGVIPFDTVTSVSGDLGLLFLNIPIKGRVSCEVYVSTNNQTIVRQDCYPV